MQSAWRVAERLDVLIVSEEVCRVILRLERGEAVMVVGVRLPDALVSFVAEVVHVDARA
jgi:hypothetical protein